MFKTTAEFKKFITWAKEAGLKSAKVGDFAFELSDIAIAIDYEASKKPKYKATEEKDTSKTIVDDEQAKNIADDEDLFWSTN